MKIKRVPSKHRSDIPGVLIYPDGRERTDNSVAGTREYDRRLGEMASRQLNLCAICVLPMMTPTWEHENLRGKDIDERIEVNGIWKNAAVHGHCNGAKGSKRYTWDYSGTWPKYVPVNKDQAT